MQHLALSFAGAALVFHGALLDTVYGHDALLVMVAGVALTASAAIGAWRA